MSGFSGVNGSVKIGSTPIAEVTKWSFKPSSNNPSWNSSSTGGTKARVAGVKDGSGQIEAKYDTGTSFLSVIDVGVSVTLKLYVDSTHFFSVPSIIDSYDITVDVDSGDVVGFSSDFSVNGPWANP